MIMQLLAIAALVTWAVSTALVFSNQPLWDPLAGRVVRSVLFGLLITFVIFVVTGTLVALGSIALGVQW